MKNLLPSVCHSDDCKEEESLPKNEERDSSHILGMTRGYRPSLLIAGNVGEGKMPAFIGLPGAREKTEIGRGLFERSEFRSPRRRAKREAGIPDNQRATFLGYFFAVGKKLRNAVILRGETPQNLHQVRILLPLL